MSMMTQSRLPEVTAGNSFESFLKPKLLISIIIILFMSLCLFIFFLSPCVSFIINFVIIQLYLVLGRVHGPNIFL